MGKTVGSISKLRNDFLKLPEESDPEFMYNITNIARDRSLTSLEADAMEILGDASSYDERTRYAAFYCLVLFHRYANEPEIAKALVAKYEGDFSSHKTYSHLSYLIKLSAGDTINIQDVERIYSDIEQFSNNAPVQHLFADMVATYYENHPEFDKSSDYDKWFQRAMGCVDAAIRNRTNYAKYYETKSRLLLINHELGGAFDAINSAIAFESARNNDYALRVSRYINYKIKIQLEKESNDADKKLKKVKAKIDKLDGSLVRNIEFIGLFSGVIALVLGGINIATSYPYADAAKLILLLFCALICAFSCLGLVLGKRDKFQLGASILSFLIGVAAIAFLGRGVIF